MKIKPTNIQIFSHTFIYYGNNKNWGIPPYRDNAKSLNMQAHW